MKIYVICGGGFCKVGIAKDARKRLAQLQNGNPHNLRLRLMAEVDDNVAWMAEGTAHGILGEKALRRGEWFKVSWEIAGRAVVEAVALVGANPGTVASGLDRVEASPMDVKPLIRKEVGGGDGIRTHDTILPV